MKTPAWLRTDVVLAMHDRLLAEHGGSAGIRDETLLESTLERPKNRFAYGTPSMFELAATYACGIIKNHPFVDGNKRTGFMAAFVFLGINKTDLAASESEALMCTLAVAANKMSEETYATWLKDNSPSGKKKKH